MKRAIKPIIGLTALGLGTSLGSKAISSAGGDAGGLKAFSGFYPAMGTIAGAGITIGMLKDIGKPFIKKSRRR